MEAAGIPEQLRFDRVRRNLDCQQLPRELVVREVDFTDPPDQDHTSMASKRDAAEIDMARLKLRAGPAVKQQARTRAGARLAVPLPHSIEQPDRAALTDDP